MRTNLFLFLALLSLNSFADRIYMGIADAYSNDNTFKVFYIDPPDMIDPYNQGDYKAFACSINQNKNYYSDSMGISYDFSLVEAESKIFHSIAITDYFDEAQEPSEVLTSNFSNNMSDVFNYITDVYNHDDLSKSERRHVNLVMGSRDLVKSVGVGNLSKARKVSFDKYIPLEINNQQLYISCEHL